MEILQNALMVDAQGQETEEYKRVASTEWDEIREWSDQVYMPYDVSPKGCARKPDSSLYAANIGGIIMSRFSYGIPVHIREFSPEAGMGMVLTTIRGSARHWMDSRRWADTGVGQAFLVDNSRSDYWVDFDADHLQLNLTFPHQLLADLYERWYGHPADDDLWQRKVQFGGLGSSWLALLEHASRCISETPWMVTHGPFGKHLEEMLGINMLRHWTQHTDRHEYSRRPVIAPRYVKLAEQYMRDHARAAPTLSAVAAAVGVSVRALTGAFREFRSTTPMMFLREQRLQGIRADLLAAAPEASVTTVAQLWGYANLGLFAAAYRRRFGELPSETLRRLRRP